LKKYPKNLLPDAEAWLGEYYDVHVKNVLESVKNKASQIKKVTSESNKFVKAHKNAVVKGALKGLIEGIYKKWFEHPVIKKINSGLLGAGIMDLFSFVPVIEDYAKATENSYLETLITTLNIIGLGMVIHSILPIVLKGVIAGLEGGVIAGLKEAALAAVGLGSSIVIGIIMSLIVIKIYCHFNPGRPVCGVFCNLDNIKTAVVKKGENVNEQSYDAKQVIVKKGETLNYLAKGAFGNCIAPYNFCYFKDDNPIFESYRECRLSEDGSCLVEGKAPDTTGNYKFYFCTPVRAGGPPLYPLRNTEKEIIVVDEGTTVTTLAPTTPSGTCPSEPTSYPNDKWDRVWCDKNFKEKLADDPDETLEQFDNDWGWGDILPGKANDLGFRSGRTIYLQAGEYEFTLGSDDGSRLWIDGEECTSDWGDHMYRVSSCKKTFTSDGNHRFRIDYYESWGASRVSFSYKLLKPTTTTTIPTQKVLLQLAVVSMGTGEISASFKDVTGEEKTVSTDISSMVEVPIGTDVQISATPKSSNYKFEKFCIGTCEEFSTTQNPYKFKVESNKKISAFFSLTGKPEKVVINFGVEPEMKGYIVVEYSRDGVSWVSITGGRIERNYYANVDKDVKVRVMGVPYEGYVFDKFVNCNREEISKSNPYIFDANKDSCVIASMKQGTVRQEAVFEPFLSSADVIDAQTLRVKGGVRIKYTNADYESVSHVINIAGQIVTSLNGNYCFHGGFKNVNIGEYKVVRGSTLDTTINFDEIVVSREPLIGNIEVRLEADYSVKLEGYTGSIIYIKNMRSFTDCYKQGTAPRTNPIRITSQPSIQPGKGMVSIYIPKNEFRPTELMNVRVTSTFYTLDNTEQPTGGIYIKDKNGNQITFYPAELYWSCVNVNNGRVCNRDFSIFVPNKPPDEYTLEVRLKARQVSQEMIDRKNFKILPVEGEVFGDISITQISGPTEFEADEQLTSENYDRTAGEIRIKVDWKWKNTAEGALISLKFWELTKTDYQCERIGVIGGEFEMCDLWHKHFALKSGEGSETVNIRIPQRWIIGKSRLTLRADISLYIPPHGYAAKDSESIVYSVKTVPICSGDRTSYTSCDTAKDLGSGGTSSNMCGDQYYKVTVSQGKVCDLVWEVTPDKSKSPSTKATLLASNTSNNCAAPGYDYLWECRGNDNLKCNFNSLTPGTYFARVVRTGGYGGYSISATLSNCRDITTCVGVTSLVAEPSNVVAGNPQTLTANAPNCDGKTVNFIYGNSVTAYEMIPANSRCTVSGGKCSVTNILYRSDAIYNLAKAWIDGFGSKQTTPVKILVPTTACTYSLSINPSSAEFSDTKQTWQISAQDSSFETETGACGDSITYKLVYSTSGSCSQNTKPSVNSFSISKGQSLSNAFNITVEKTSETGDCTLYLNVIDPQNQYVTIGTYSVRSSVRPLLSGDIIIEKIEFWSVNPNWYEIQGKVKNTGVISGNFKLIRVEDRREVLQKTLDAGQEERFSLYPKRGETVTLRLDANSDGRTFSKEVKVIETQSTKVTINGYVKYKDNVPAKNARIVVSTSPTNILADVRTNENGYYTATFDVNQVTTIKVIYPDDAQSKELQVAPGETHIVNFTSSKKSWSISISISTTGGSIISSKANQDLNFVYFTNGIFSKNAIKFDKLSLQSSPTILPVGSSVTITVTVNQNVEPPYYIRIYENNTVIKTCYSGTICSVTVTKNTPGTYNYYAKVETPDGVHAVTNLVIIWGGGTIATTTVTTTTLPSQWRINISANPTSLSTGETSVITATANQDVGPTQYWIIIYEGSQRVKSCSSGTTCIYSATKYSPGTSNYYAKIEKYEGTDVQATSNTVSVTWSGGVITTTTIPPCPYSCLDSAYQCNSIGGTCVSGYYCSYGCCCRPGTTTTTTRTTTVTTTTLPSQWRINISANPTSLSTGETSVITATANQDVGPTQYWIIIYEGSQRVKSCSSGTTCIYSATKYSPGTSNYYAKIEKYEGTDVQATSNTVSVTWSGGVITTTTIPPCPYSCLDSAYQCNSIGGTCVSGYYCSYGCCCRPGTTTTTTRTTTVTTTTLPSQWRIDISANPTSLSTGETSVITATANQDVGPTQYWIIIYEGSQRVKSCSSGTTCIYSATKYSPGTYNYYAKIEKYEGTDVQATSNTVSVTWSGGVITTTTIPPCPYSCLDSAYQCNSIGGTCVSGYYCSYGCCCRPGTTTTTTRTTTVTTTTLPSGLSTTCSGRTTSQDIATISPTTNWQTISGSLSSSTDTKRYKITVTSPGQHEFSLCSADGGSANYDSYICIFDSSGNFITSNDDYCNRQSKITFSFSSTGTYYIQISGYSSNYGSYTLAYRKTPVTTTVTTTTLATTVTTTTLACGGLNQPCCSDIWGVWCNSPYVCQQGICKAPTTVTTTTSTTTRTTTVTTTTLPSGLSTTCSGRTTSQDIATISPTTNWQTISGSLSSSTDTKRYKITVTSPGQHEFSLCSADGGSANYDSYICIFDSSGNFITSNDDYCNRQSKITFSFSSTGTYYIQISGYSSNYGSYTLAYRKTPVTTTVTTTTLATTVTTTTLACGGLNQPCCSDIWGVWCNSPYVCQQGICKAPTTVTTTTSTTTRTTTVTTTTTTISTCDSSSYASCTSAYNFGTGSGSKSNMCGSYQYYKVSTPFDKTCDITWTITPDSNSDYDLYVKWSSACPSISDYDCSSLRTTGQTETCSKTSFSGTAYALVRKYSGSGSYTISVSVTNCR
jgi:hypothetical protein